MNDSDVSANEHELRAHLAAIVESSDDAILSKDLNGIITSWNAGAERLYRYTAGEAIGQSVSMLVPEGREDEIPAIMERLQRGERVDHYETVRQTKDGRLVDVSLTISPIRNKDGQIVGASAVARNITGRQRTQEVLVQVIEEAERQKRLYETIFTATPDLVYVFDLNYRFIYANDALLAMWGRTWEESAGKSLLEIGYEPWHAQMHEREIDQVIATKKPVRGEVPFPHHSLGRRIYDYIFVPILTPDGEVEAVAGTTRDVTDYRQAEEALRRSEQQRRVALKAAQMGTWDYDVATDRLHWDARTASLFGMQGMHSIALPDAIARLHPDDQAWVRQEISQALDPQSDGRYDIEYRVTPPDGERRWLRAVGQVIFDGEGPNRQATRFVGVVFDTTEARTAREALEQANRQAERNLAQLEAIIGQMTEGLVIADPQGNILSMNDTALAFHDLSSLDEVRRHLHDFEQLLEVSEVDTNDRLPPDAWPMARTLNGETFLEREIQIRNRRTGRVWIASCGGTTVRDKTGDVQLAILTVRDVTERHQAEHELQQLNETLEQRVAERTAEAEKRAGQLQLMAKELTEAEQRERRRLAQLLHDDLQQILVAAKMRLNGKDGTAQQVRQLVEQAIETARSLSTELAPPVLYDLGLNAALDWLARWAQDKYALKVTVSSDGAVSVEDEQLRVMLFEAVRELLLNVVKHAEVTEARVTLRHREEQFNVMVEDFGVGFDPELHRDKARLTGYGLFSLQERLEVSGGRVYVDSAPGRGTRVEIAVPLATPGRTELAESVGPLAAAPVAVVDALPTDDTSRIRVLLTDDHEVVRRGLVNLIAAQPDMELVAEAASGEEAVTLAQRLRPDVVVMDISLPGISGIEATRRIVRERAETRVVGLSIHEEQDVTEALRSAGAAAFFNKSEAVDQLIRAIRDLAPVARADSDDPDKATSSA